MSTHASPEVLEEALAPTRTHIVADLALHTVPPRVRPDQAESFNLSWREKDKSGSWGFHCKSLPPSVGLKLVVKHAETPEETTAREHATWVAMFGPNYCVDVGEW